MNDRCPYCKAEVEICHDDGYGYEEGQYHQQDCGECGKIFVYTTAISVDHDLTKADCLNGSPHEFKFIHAWPAEYSKMRCANCGEDRKPTDEEMKAHIA